MADEDNERLERRANDTAIAVLQVEHKGLREDVTETKALLREHVTGCAKLQKYVLGMLLFVAGLVMADSPKAAKVISTIISVLG